MPCTEDYLLLSKKSIYTIICHQAGILCIDLMLQQVPVPESKSPQTSALKKQVPEAFAHADQSKVPKKSGHLPQEALIGHCKSESYHDEKSLTDEDKDIDESVTTKEVSDQSKYGAVGLEIQTGSPNTEKRKLTHFNPCQFSKI